MAVRKRNSANLISKNIVNSVRTSNVSAAMNSTFRK